MKPFQDLSGMRFGRLIVQERVQDRIQPSGQHCAMWQCVCDCGNTCVVSAPNLKSGHTQSCGCLQKHRTSVAHLADLSGQTFGSVYVIERAGTYQSPDGASAPLWLCQCSCGKYFIAHSGSLRSGATKSCGCSRRIDLRGKQFGKLTVIAPADDYVNAHGVAITQWLCRCTCGTELVVRTRSLTSGNTQSCGCIGSSIAELSIKELLTTLGVNFKQEYTFSDFKTGKTPQATPRFDFGILDHDDRLVGLIEYQGPHHYIPRFKNWGDRQRLVTDPLKREYCTAHQIPLLEIPYTDDVEPAVIQFLNDLNIPYANTVPSLNHEEGVTTISEEST